MSRMADHLIIAPVVLPLLAGAAMLLWLGERRRNFKAAINVASTFALVGIAIALLGVSDAAPDGSQRGVYRLGDWPAPFGIVLVVDRLSALMLLLTSILASRRRGVLARALAPRGRAFPFAVPVPADGPERRVPDGRSLQPVRLLRGAARRLLRPGAARFGPRARQGRAALHRGQPCGLAAVSDRRQPDLRRLRNAQHGGSRRAHSAISRAEDRALLEAGAGILGIAFLLKAGMWPLCFWLPTTYAAASPPVAAIFAIMTKVGVYIVLRLWLLLFGDEAGASAAFRRRLAAVRRHGDGRVRRHRDAGISGHGAARRLLRAGVLRNGARRDRYGAESVSRAERSFTWSARRSASARSSFWSSSSSGARTRRGRARRHTRGLRRATKSTETEEVGIAIPATMGMLGLAFIGCALVIAGLPPLSGFVAKFALLTAALNPSGASPGGPVPAASWALLVVLILSGLASFIAMTRAGIRVFWASPDRSVPRVRLIEMAPVAILLIFCAAQTIQAGPIMRFMQATAQSLHAPGNYVRAVLAHNRKDEI